MKRMSKAFYLGSFVGAAALLFIFVIIVGLVVSPSINMEISKAKAMTIILLTLVVCFAVILYLFVVTGMMFYKMWDAIRDGGTSVSPGLAVVLLLIPLVNLVWTLIVYPLYMKCYNEYAGRSNAGVKALRPGLFYAYPILFGIYLVCSITLQIVYFLPESATPSDVDVLLFIVGMITAIASFVVFLILISKICDAVNELPHIAGGLTAGSAKVG